MSKDYRNSRDVNWNSAELFFKSLQKFKDLFGQFSIYKDVENMLSTLQEIYYRVYPFVLEFEEIETVKDNLKKAENLVYINTPDGQYYEKHKNILRSEALKLLKEAYGILNVLEARKGMTIQKTEDPMKKRRKYGDN